MDATARILTWTQLQEFSFKVEVYNEHMCTYNIQVSFRQVMLNVSPKYTQEMNSI